MVRRITKRLAHRGGITAVLLLGLTVAGCAAKKNMALEQARTAYLQAQQNPAITLRSGHIYKAASRLSLACGVSKAQSAMP